jgi:signal transduction histidine kinase
MVRARREQQGGRALLRVDVADQGPGIPSELLHRVFEPFFTTKAKGTGLGLAVVKRILEEHRGEVAVESTPGRGTTFTFRLPLTQP